MDKLIPWERLEKRIEPFYPKPGRGRRAYPLGTMLRVHCVQLFLRPERSGDGGVLGDAQLLRRYIEDALPGCHEKMASRHL